jgi:hypothetical protein
MTRRARLPLGIRKELRALAPMWFGAAATIVAGTILHDGGIWIASLLAFVLGSIALGAHAIGHEYTHRTLGVLLALPRHRERVLLTKLGALAPMLLTLALLAWVTLFRDPELLRTIGWSDFPSPWLVSASSLCVAPWLTMLCRSTMGGVVFTVALSPLLLVLGNVAGGLSYGFDGAAPIDRVTFAVHFWGVLAFCVIGAVAGWRAFMRLEAIEGGGREFHLPLWTSARRAARRRSPIQALIAKELRLQQLTFVLFGLFAAGGTALTFAGQTSEAASRALEPLLMFYTALLSILIGSLATAEERQFGTMDVQLLLPVAIWKQWIVKAGVALGLALTLGVVVPQLGTMFLPDSPAFDVEDAWRSQTRLVFVLTSTSLYVSSLCSTGVRAAVLSVPTILGIGLFAQLFWAVLWKAYRSPLHLWAASMLPVHRDAFLHRALGWTPLVFVALVSVVMLWLAFRNYRHGERGARRIAFQVCCVAAVIALFLTAQFVASTAALLR